MKRNDRLFRLIKSLSKSEKRFFKIYSERHVIGDRNNYVELFDTIDRQQSYQEEAILKKFADRKFAQRLSVAKNYLYELILKSMNQYQAQNSIDAELRELLGNVQFLYDKNLLDQAEKTINKARRIATEYEQLPILPQILAWQKKIMEAQHYFNQAEAELNRLYTDQLLLADQLKNLNEHWLLQAQVYYLHTHKGMLRQPTDQQHIEQLLQHPLLQTEQNTLSYDSRLLRFRTLSTGYFVLRNFEQCYLYSQKMVQLLQTRPELRRLDALSYINALNNLLNMTALLGKHTERRQYIGQLKTMLTDRVFLQVDSVGTRLFEAYHYHLMTWHISQATCHVCLAETTDMEATINQQRLPLDPMGRAMLRFYAFHIAFETQHYLYAYHLLHKIIAEDPSQLRPDIYQFAHLLLPIAAYHITPTATDNNNDNAPAWLLRTELLRLYRFLLQQHEPTYYSQTLLLQWLQRRRKHPQQASTLPPLAELAHAVQQQLQQPQEARIQAYFNFSGWLQQFVPQQSPLH